MLVGRVLRVEGWEVAKKRLALVGFEQIIDRDVLERRRALKASPDLCCIIDNRRGDHQFILACAPTISACAKPSLGRCRRQQGSGACSVTARDPSEALVQIGRAQLSRAANPCVIPETLTR